MLNFLRRRLAPRALGRLANLQDTVDRLVSDLALTMTEVDEDAEIIRGQIMTLYLQQEDLKLGTKLAGRLSMAISDAYVTSAKDEEQG